MGSSKGFIRRMLPFFATFAVGLFIASFFVSVGPPRFRGKGWERHRRFEQIQIENDQLKIENGRVTEENIRLKNILAGRDWAPSEIPTVKRENWKNRGPEFPVIDAPLAPVPPPAPRRNR